MSKVLIVDDAKFMRMTLSNLFKKHQLEVVGLAENGEEGTARYKKTAPDIVTLDITMPIMDGLTALKEIIAYDHAANIVMCSAMGQQKLAVEAIEFGAKDFIIKPFDEGRVMGTVNRILQTSS